MADWNLKELKEAYDGLRDSYHKLQEGWDREIEQRAFDKAHYEAIVARLENEIKLLSASV